MDELPNADCGSGNLADNLSEITDPLLASIIDSKYEIVSMVGRGASGTVYAAMDILLGRKLAVKVLHQHLMSDSKARDRFLQESLTVASLDHPGIIKVFSRGSLANGQLYLVMDFAEGEELSALLARGESLEPATFFSIFEEILDALSFAHKNAVIHRDIKPSNIMLANSSERVRAKILDFGLAKNIVPQANLVQTATAAQLGTSAYMSPEQCQGGAVDGRSDLYSLACVMYETLLGRAPFAGGSDMEIMYKQVHNTITHSNRLAGMPVVFRSFLTRALQKNPDKRFQSADEMKQALLMVKKAAPDNHKMSYVPGLTAGLIAGVLFLALVAFLPAIQNPQKNIEDPDEAEISRLHDEHGLNYLLSYNKKLSEQRKIEISRKWLERRLKSSSNKWKDFLSSELTFATYLRAIGHGEEAYELYGTILKYKGLSKEQVVETHYYRGVAAESCTSFDRALKSLLESLALNDGDSSRCKTCKTQCLICLSRCYAGLQEGRKAEDYARKAVASYSDDNDPLYFNTLINLARILIDNFKQVEAEQLTSTTLNKLEINNANGGMRDYFDLKHQCFVILATCASSAGQYKQAEDFLLKARQLGRKIPFGDRQLCSQLAELYGKMGQFGKAIEIRQKLASEVKPADGFFSFAGEHLRLAVDYRCNKQAAKALKELESTLADWQACAGQTALFGPPDYRVLVNILEQIRMFRKELGTLKEYPDFSRARLSSLPEKGYERAGWLTELARYYDLQNQHVEAEQKFQQALSALPSFEEGLIVSSLQMALAQQLSNQRKFDEALALVKSVVEQSSVPTIQKAMARRLEAEIARTRGKLPEELRLRQEALSLCERDNSTDYPDLEMLEAELAVAYQRAGKNLEAIKLLERAGSNASKLGPDHVVSLLYYSVLEGQCYLNLNKFADAGRCLEAVASGFARDLKSGSQGQIRISSELADSIRAFLKQMQAAANERHDSSTAEKSQKLGKEITAYCSAAKAN